MQQKPEVSDLLQFEDVLNGLLGVSLGLLHVSAQHAVHDRDEVDEDTQLVPGQPDELLGGRAAGELPLGRPVRRCDRLDAALQLLQDPLHRLHLAHHQVVAHLRVKMKLKNL